MKDRIYLCIDLKTFYASCECVDRGLDPFTTNLIVADPSRGNGAICLAISPAMKALGIHNRCRVFEIPKNVKYIVALPRMKRYMEISAQIYSIYLKYVAPEDIHVYSIDECFIDATSYLSLYKKSPKELAKIIMDDVYSQTGICATAGIGTNLFLCKVALDISAKHAEDHMGYLDEKLFKETLWHHKPITDIWNISRGIANRLLKYGVSDLYGITQIDEKILYKEFGVNAELLIDHAWGKESCTIEDIHKYKSKSNSLSNSQVLFEDYDYEDALLVVKEMVDLKCLELIDKHLMTNSIYLGIGYSKDVRKPTGGSFSLDEYTSSEKKLMNYFIRLFTETTDPLYPIRKISIGFGNVIDENFICPNLFTDVEGELKEKKAQQTILAIKKKYGKNAILKAMNYENKATTRKRNKLIGGHNSGEDD